ncbi:MAG: hypothetical protein M3R08_05015 [Bacteroidota bacterium]|nr:hypothetical protein [Bacteroidota bacterium]
MNQNRQNILFGALGASLLFLFLSAAAIGQGTSIHHFRLIDAPLGLNGYGQKNVIQIVKDLDPASAVSFHLDLLKVRLDAAMGHDELLTSLNASGLGTFELLDHDLIMTKIGILASSDEDGLAEQLELMRVFYPDIYVQYMDSVRRALPAQK